MPFLIRKVGVVGFFPFVVVVAAVVVFVPVVVAVVLVFVPVVVFVAVFVVAVAVAAGSRMQFLSQELTTSGLTHDSFI